MENQQQEEQKKAVEQLAQQMLACLERALGELDMVTGSVKEKQKTEQGVDVTVDYTRLMPQERGIIDRGGLKQLTGVLKDLKDILVLRTEADTREQEARIARLEREVSRDEGGTQLRVTLEGGCAAFAE